VRPFFQNIGRGDFRNGSIAICTYEKAHSLVHAAIKGRYEKQIRLVVIDEVHMIGDESRGVVCESLLLKLRTLIRPPLIIALTATLNESDARQLAARIDGFCYFSGTRPTPLCYYIAMPDGTMFKYESGSLVAECRLKSSESDKDHLVPLVKHDPGRSVLIFVNTRNDARRIALFLARNIDSSAPPETSERRKELLLELGKCSAGKDSSLELCISAGVAFHHAGLLLE
jgi:replicative superfamily II helicase